MPIFKFPFEFVYWDKIENHEEIKKELLPIILEKNDKTKNNPFNASDFNTSYYRNDKMFSENEFLTTEKILNNVVFNSLKNALKELTNTMNYEFNNGDSFVQSCWWNVYNEKEHQELHEHKGPQISFNDKLFYPSFSMIYILHDENEKSSVVFRQKGPLPLMKPHHNFTFDTSNVETIGEGSIIIFPYTLSHLVKPCIKPGRITIAYNLYSTY